MNTKTPLYISIVPPALSSLIREGTLAPDDFKSYAKLSTILSVADVSFYHNYIMNLSLYCGDLFDDFILMCNTDENKQWVDDNINIVCDIAAQVQSVINRLGSDLTHSMVPLSVRKAEYEPMIVGIDTLMLVPVSEPHGMETHSFIEHCVRAVGKLTTPENLKSFNIFKQMVVQL